jgi:hypothetical protein
MRLTAFFILLTATACFETVHGSSKMKQKIADSLVLAESSTEAFSSVETGKYDS